MTNINPIKFGVSGQQFFAKENNEELAKEASKEGKKETAAKEITANDVLGFLAATNADIKPANVKKAIEVSKYVNEEQTARIEDFMKTFEENFDVISATALEEFPDITQETASSIALSYINQTY